MLNRGNIIYSLNIQEYATPIEKTENNLVSKSVFKDNRDNFAGSITFSDKNMADDNHKSRTNTHNGVHDSAHNSVHNSVHNGSKSKLPGKSQNTDSPDNHNIPNVKISFFEINNGDTDIKFNDGAAGSFKISDIIRYILKDCIDNIGTDDEIFLHIKKLFFRYDGDNIIFKPYANSPITGNLEVLLKIARSIKIYEKAKLNDILVEVNVNGGGNKKSKCESKIKYFNYVFNGHILETINSIIQMISNDNTKIDLLYKLQRYSTNIMNKINQYIHHELMALSNKENNLDDIMAKLTESKKNLHDKINITERELLIQNQKLDSYVDKIDTYNKYISNQQNKITENTNAANIVDIVDIVEVPANPKAQELLILEGGNLSQSIENKLSEKLSEKLGKTVASLFDDNENDNGFEEIYGDVTNMSIMNDLSDENSIHKML